MLAANDDHGGEDWGPEGWGIECGQNPHPQPSRVQLSLPAMTQQLTIAASDHSETALDEANDAVAQGRGFPMLGANAIDAVNDIGDLTIAGAVDVPIGRLEHVAMAPLLLLRQTAIGRHRSPLQGAQKTVDGVDSVVPIGVKRHERGEWDVAYDASKPHQTNCLAAGFEQEMHALLVRLRGCLAQLGEEVVGRRQNGWRVREQHGAGIRLGRPQHRMLASTQRRRDEKTASPISYGSGALGQDYPRWHSPAGIPCFA